MRGTAIALLLCLVALAAGAQQVTKVGICDWMKVLSSSYRDTKAVRDFYDAQQTIRKEQQAIEREISDLDNKRLEADKAGSRELVLQLEKQLADKRAYLDSYKKIKGDWLKQQADRILSSTTFVREILEVVKVVAESEGLALVLRSDGTAGAELILFNIAEIDITTKVIQEIFRRAGKTWTGEG